MENTVIKEYKVGNFKVVLTAIPSDDDPADYFDGGLDGNGNPYYDHKKIAEKIASGIYQWFNLEVKVSRNNQLLATEYVNANLYQKVTDVLDDGVADELVELAMDQAVKAIVDDELIEATLVRLENKLDSIIKRLEAK